MTTSADLRNQRMVVWERMKEIINGAEAENRELTQEEETNLQQLHKDYDALHKRVENQELLERTAPPAPEPRKVRIEDAMGDPNPKQSVRATPEYAKAFRSWLVCEKTADLDSEDRKILAYVNGNIEQRMEVGLGGAPGGYLVPEEFERAIVQNMLFFGGMRESSRIITTDTGADLIWPTSDDTANVGRILNETAAVTRTDATVGRRIYKAFMYSSDEIRVSLQFLQDAAVDAEGWLRGLMAERIARITNTHFTTGQGPNLPSGVVNDAAAGVTGVAGQATSFTLDNMIALTYAVNRAYRPGSRFMWRDATEQFARQIKDGEGRYMWQPSVQANEPATFMGYPITTNPDVAAQAANARSILFGNFQNYIIRDVRGFTLLRLDERYADNLQVAFIGFSRHDGGLLNAGTNPIQAYVNGAS